MPQRKTLYLGDSELMEKVNEYIESNNISLSHFTQESYRRFLKVEKLKADVMKDTPVNLGAL